MLRQKRKPKQKPKLPLLAERLKPPPQPQKMMQVVAKEKVVTVAKVITQATA